jgi:heptosyltransferase-2
MPAKPRILVIRGGAIGDFVLTLPAVRLLRENFPQAHIELLGYRHIVALAEGRYYADAVRSIEYGPLAGFFVPNGELDAELVEYFAGFQQVVSYLFDPDGSFEANLRRAGVRHFLRGPAKLDDTAHAARQLARPLESLALYHEDDAAVLHPSAADRAFAGEFLKNLPGPVVAVHPGSGSTRKNWPVENWRAVAARLARAGHSLLVVGGEADHAQLAAMRGCLPAGRAREARDLPLPHLAAVLERCAAFAGHDSGISHIAVAAGTPSVLLFGPTDPEVWAPVGKRVRVLRGAAGRVGAIPRERVFAEIGALLADR